MMQNNACQLQSSTSRIGLVSIFDLLLFNSHACHQHWGTVKVSTPFASTVAPVLKLSSIWFRTLMMGVFSVGNFHHAKQQRTEKPLRSSTAQSGDSIGWTDWIGRGRHILLDPIYYYSCNPPRECWISSAIRFENTCRKSTISCVLLSDAVNVDRRESLSTHTFQVSSFRDWNCTLFWGQWFLGSRGPKFITVKVARRSYTSTSNTITPCIWEIEVS